VKALVWGGLAALAVLVVAAAEGFGHWLGSDVRVAVYAGGIAGIVLALIGLPFSWKLSGMAGDQSNSAAFWKWWGASFLSRLAALLVFGVILGIAFNPQLRAALLSMSVIYLIGMFAEASWLATKFFKKADEQKVSLNKDDVR
jgi:hypothetical protein